jgi:hypothetical protein
MKELVEGIAKALVDYLDDVDVKVVEGTQVTVLELRTHPGDLSKVIGRLRWRLWRRSRLGSGKRGQRQGGEVWEGIREHE